MKRLAPALILVVAVVVAVIGGATATSSEGGPYKFTAIFDNAAALVPGEDVKVAGVKVGRVDRLSLTPDRKRAMIEMTITRPGIGPFRTNAECTIRPQSLIGEKFVECQPGTVDHPLLRGADGEPPSLTIDHTHSLVDIDLINNIFRLSYRDRLRLIINEFGTALAGNGDALNEAIRRSNPALDQTNRVLQVLAQQNRTLRQLIVNSDAVFQPLATRRRQVGDFIDQAAKVQQAVAARRGDLELSIKGLPALLNQLRPTLAQLGAFADEMTPVLIDLHGAAPDLSKTLVELGPFTSAATPALKTLGDTADAGVPALKSFEPIAKQLQPIAQNSVPLARNLAQLLGDLQDTGAFGQLATTIFNASASINAFDGIGHVARARIIASTCSEYAESQQEATSKKGSCDAHLNKGGKKSVSSAAAALDYLLGP